MLVGPYHLRNTDPIFKTALPMISIMMYTPIVAIGSSAGGLAAMILFFKALAPDSGRAFVCIQHLKSDTVSLTPLVLGRITAMPVTEGRPGERVLPNHVYTMRPDSEVTVKNGRFQMTTRVASSDRHKPFDRFLKSLALDGCDHAAAVILSGFDGDGSDGFIAIKACGGSTYAQDQTAIVSEMPRHAVATGCVDHVLDPGSIASVLSRAVAPVSHRMAMKSVGPLAQS